MIPLARPPLDDELAASLQRRGDELVRKGADGDGARRAWNGARADRGRLRELLAGMASGIERCMYCGDSLGTSIDHFEPLKEAPLRAFDWLNHLLACSMCNSNEKRDRFPRASCGTPLLVDPSRDDPYDHIRLVLATGRYRWRTERGESTVEVFGLNRSDLVLGRMAAVERTEAMVLARGIALDAGNEAKATRLLVSLLNHPFVDVLYAMVRTADSPGAVTVLEPATVVGLKDPVYGFRIRAS
ncbi:HNH endonuclease [Actinomadura sp. 9N407]|uniref:HNH endonuclease n=1 Tax=Actinomadura sp. 9N407 TaxID=3375154 RepID=UPI0037BA0F86